MAPETLELLVQAGFAGVVILLLGMTYRQNSHRDATVKEIIDRLISQNDRAQEKLLQVMAEVVKHHSPPPSK